MRIYLDESGRFDGTEDGVVAGPIFSEGAFLEANVSKLLDSLVSKHYGTGGLPAGIHGTKMRKAPGRYRAYLTDLLDTLEAFHGDGFDGFFVAEDHMQVGHRDRNVAHAAVAARALAEFAVELGRDWAADVTLAGRSTDLGQITSTDHNISVVVGARVGEILAARNIALSAKDDFTCRVVHLGECTDWADATKAALMVGDLVSNLVFRPGQWSDLRDRVLDMAAAHIELTPERTLSVGERLYEDLGASAFLQWLYGPAGDGELPEFEELTQRALRQLPGRALRGLLESLSDAVDVALRDDRDLDSAQELASRLTVLTGRIDDPEIAAPFVYRALNARLDVANHRGDINLGDDLVAQEEDLRERLAPYCLAEAIGFQNRAAEVDVNAFRFDRAGRRLDELSTRLTALDDIFPLRHFAHWGRVKSHRAQVHHYLGEDATALTLYTQCARFYSSDWDKNILRHHKARAELGSGRFERARSLLGELGVRRALAQFPWNDPFTLDLTVLYFRVVGDVGALTGADVDLLETLWTQVDEVVAEMELDYPAPATLRNLARVAAQCQDWDRSSRFTNKAIACCGPPRTTLVALGMAAALEGLENHGDRTCPEAETWLASAKDALKRLGRPGSATAPWFGSLEHWVRRRSIDAVLTDRDALHRAVRTVPFGLVGGARVF